MNEIFRLDQPLPARGTTMVLEASAGTGKTYTIAAMVTRYVAEGLPIDQILAVTFSRRATSELRDGIRNRLIAGKAALDDWLREGRRDADDAIAMLLTEGDPATVRLRATRLDQAIGQVDAAPIFTLHTFASRMLDELGVLADHDQVTELAADPSVLIDEVIADVYLGDERWQQLGWELAQAIGRQAAFHPCDRLYPPGPQADLRVSFAATVREVLDERKHARRVFDYDDMIGRLSAALTDPVSGEAAAGALSERFSVVLVDEFQDTDPAQWTFLEAGFAGRSALVLIGDPKQAIYRFRGGDIETYDQARRQADSLQRLGTNYRSDAEVVRGIENLFGPIDLGSPGVQIQFQRVEAAQDQPRIRRQGSGGPGEVVRVRALEPPQPFKSVVDARELIAADLLTQVGLLLDGSHQFRDPDGRWRPVRPDDIAVLISTNKVGRLIHSRLVEAGYSAVFTGERSVFTSPAAADWLVMLQGLENPDRWHQRRAMLTSLIGLTSADIASATDDELIEMTSLLTRCARRLADQGVAAVFETLVAERELYARLLSTAGGEELISDLRQITELLNQAQSMQHLTASALAEFLRRNIDQANSADEDERVRRLPTDRPAIRVMTVHKAKGLQFPIVLLPQAADKYTPEIDDRDQPVVGHRDGERVLDVDSPRGRSDRIEGYQAEDLAESLRSFYVACTRAQSLVICWWAPTKNAIFSPLHRLLMNDDWTSPLKPRFFLEGAAALRRPPKVNVAVVDPDQIARRPGRESHQTGFTGLLDARSFTDRIDRAWTRTSYTGLTAEVHELGPMPVSAAGFDEVEVTAQTEDTQADPATQQNESAAASALAELPGGVQFGSLVHAVLEEVDPAGSRLQSDLETSVQRLSARYPLTGLDTAALVTGLMQIVTTPLGVLSDDHTLRDLGATRRLAELDFEMPLGQATGGRRTVKDLADCFTTMLGDDDPLQRYGALLADSSAADTMLAGFLTGSIDVVLQVPGDHDRYVVLDYKTNRLPSFGPEAMTDAMCQAHYPLQALLYSVALHRYLTWRLPGYDPHTHLGGVGYLFVRGMSGPTNPVLGTMPSGVFTWRPPAEMIVAASQVLAGGAR